MTRFLEVLGSADQELTFVSPIRDEKGQEVLDAGFLDNLKRRIDPTALREAMEDVPRIDPALLDRPDLAVAPADARRTTVALAAIAHDPAEIARLAPTASPRSTGDRRRGRPRCSSRRAGPTIARSRGTTGGSTARSSRRRWLSGSGRPTPQPQSA